MQIITRKKVKRYGTFVFPSMKRSSFETVPLADLLPRSYGERSTAVCTFILLPSSTRDLNLICTEYPKELDTFLVTPFVETRSPSFTRTISASIRSWELNEYDDNFPLGNLCITWQEEESQVIWLLIEEFLQWRFPR
jgi:hypothetical protein